jgi:hypothetical protein
MLPTRGSTPLPERGSVASAEPRRGSDIRRFTRTALRKLGTLFRAMATRFLYHVG